MAVEAVVLDVGETLVDETRAWLDVARRADVPAFTLLGVLGGLAERQADHRQVWGLLGVAGVDSPAIEPRDFYPDALPCLQRLRAAGLLVGLAGNQPERAAEDLAGCGIDVDLIATSFGWGVHKPSPEFFARVSGEIGCAPEKIAYVGDRVDNDVAPALRAGMVAVHIRRGPWGYLQEPPPGAVGIRSLDELPAVLS
ncbi:MAG: HAD family hydrolase [Gaiellaceae bacterium]